MITTRIFVPESPVSVSEAEITATGLRGRDDLVTVIDEATLAYCLGEGKGGLCTAKFNADLIVDELENVPRGAHIILGSALLQNQELRKHCHPGCSLESSRCLLHDRVLFLKVKNPGFIRSGDELIVRN